MSIDAYKAKVRTEHGEEVVEAWLESMKTVTKWKVAEPKEEEPKADYLEAKEVTEESADPASEPEDAPELAALEQYEEAPATEEPAAEVEAPAAEESPAVEESDPDVEESPAEESPAEESEAEEGAP